MQPIISTLLSPLSKGWAYIDPGTGSFLVQLLVAGFFGLLFVFRNSLKKIVHIFRRPASKSEDNTDHEQSSQP